MEQVKNHVNILLLHLSNSHKLSYPFLKAGCTCLETPALKVLRLVGADVPGTNAAAVPDAANARRAMFFMMATIFSGML